MAVSRPVRFSNDGDAAMRKRRDIVLRITEYLSNGGLFNPELMPHSDVRDLLLACRDEIIAARACAEMMLQGTGQKICESMAMRALYRQWIPVEERLPSEGSGGVLGFRRSDIAAGEHSYGMAWNHGGKLAWNEPMTPTHWMPLPAPPTSLDAVREQWDQLHKGPRPMPEVE